MTTDDALYRFRLRALALSQELGNVRAACRAMGIHPSTYYRWKRKVLRFGPEILMPRERRRPKMARPGSEPRLLPLVLDLCRLSDPNPRDSDCQDDWVTERRAVCGP